MSVCVLRVAGAAGRPAPRPTPAGPMRASLRRMPPTPSGPTAPIHPARGSLPAPSPLRPRPAVLHQRLTRHGPRAPARRRHGAARVLGAGTRHRDARAIRRAAPSSTRTATPTLCRSPDPAGGTPPSLLPSYLPESALLRRIRSSRRSRAARPDTKCSCHLRAGPVLLISPRCRVRAGPGRMSAWSPFRVETHRPGLATSPGTSSGIPVRGMRHSGVKVRDERWSGPTRT